MLSAVILILCSCSQSPTEVLESIMNNLESTAPKADSVLYKDYRELYALYKERNSSYFENTETAINTLIGQKYAYGITAYKHSDELAEIAEMFFDDNAENNLNIYFALRGYEDKEYTENDNSAEYKCKKKNDSYLYNACYDAENKSFEISLSVNGELKDSFKCDLSDDSIIKLCYSGSLDRTFVSRANKDGTSRIDWYEGLTENGEEVDENEHGYVIYDGKALSGVIK